MSFQIEALNGAQFEAYFAMSDAELEARGGRRVVATADAGYPCRVSMQDAKTGETLVLVNHEHLAVNSPYRSRHAIYVREGAEQAQMAVGEVPEVLSSRLLAVRGLDGKDMIVEAEIVEGTDLAATLNTMFADKSVEYAQVYNAKRGCFAANVRRA